MFWFPENILITATPDCPGAEDNAKIVIKLHTVLKVNILKKLLKNEN